MLELLGSGQMEMKMAGLMLYGLQTASANLKNTKFEAEKPTDVVIDRNTVDQTFSQRSAVVCEGFCGTGGAGAAGRRRAGSIGGGG